MKMQPLRSSKIISALICITLLFSLSACMVADGSKSEIYSENLPIAEESKPPDINDIELVVQNYKQNEVELYAVEDSSSDFNCWIIYREGLPCYRCGNYAHQHRDREKRQEIFAEIWERALETELCAEEISRINYDVALGFLRQHLTLFFDIWHTRAESFEDVVDIWRHDNLLQFDEISDAILIRLWYGEIYDMLGNQIARVVGEGTGPMEFSLYNLFGDNIPQIVFRNFSLDSCAANSTIYKFSEGAYELAFCAFISSCFFRSESGEIFLVEFNGWESYYRLHLIESHEGALIKNRLCYDCLPDPNTLLRVRSLTALEEKITDIVRGN